MDAANTWTDERVELLRKLWASGKSASQIAAEIGGVTRNAVIGKVHRLGLSGRGKAKAPAPTRARTSPVKAEPKSEPAKVAPKVVSLPLAEAPVVEPLVNRVAVNDLAIAMNEVALPTSERVALIDLRESMCRWPLGDPMSADFGFCGGPSAPGVPYCPHHCQIAYQPVAERRRERKVS